MSMERNSNIMNINKQESSSVQDGAVQVVQQLLPIKLESEKKKVSGCRSAVQYLGNKWLTEMEGVKFEFNDISLYTLYMATQLLFSLFVIFCHYPCKIVTFVTFFTYTRS
ncbi:uncharacterized protein LOC107884320 isoform X1 [Acyrthosiphon pisum]|uniref:Uncharacterized protein n=1 Tax=Acyrthosiphon pisum TaxID=7029 RepID=A0A8R2NSW9_ACYPI|nr:uncharacterized protein LOC107884320 isoform X1 [Acyrthosiphon pisum]